MSLARLSTPAMSSTLFPVFLDLRDRQVLVVGGGAVARRKVEALLAASARVRVGAPALAPALQAWADAGVIEHVSREFEARWLDDVWLVIAATDDADINRAVAEVAETRRIWVNVVDDAPLCSLQLPARVERGPLQIAISSGGHAPMLARHLRERLEVELDPSLGELAELLARHRARIRRRYPDLARRRDFFDRVLRGRVAQSLRRKQTLAAEHALLAALDASAQAEPGMVILVGAGPGDPGLLTLRGLRALNEADVILHDRLVSKDVLALARRDAEKIEVGKEAGRHHVSQDEIHACMLAHARAGKRVVRLKGGDSFVFGRGGEELEFLRAHDIDYEVVPGITAALACAAYAGIPLTHREHAQSVHLSTAHRREGADSPDWDVLAAQRQTLALYMGVAGLESMRDGLIAHGRAADTPCALVENGTRPTQRVIATTLGDLPDAARAHGVQSPALLFVGDVAALAERLHWFGKPPLPAASTPMLAEVA